MNSPQSGLFEEPGRSSQYLEYQLKSAAIEDVKSALRKALQPVPDVHILVAFGRACWHRLQPEWCPEQLMDFKARASEKGHVMPGTQQDLFVWIVAEDRGDLMTAIVQVAEALASVADITLDLDGYKTREARIITGFVDGTGNPKGDKKRQAALIPEGSIGEGGSFVIGQKWTHRYKEFMSLSVRAQEQVIGRTKETNIELEGTAQPPNSHVSRTDIDVNDVPMKMYRRGTPYGNASDKGLYFLAFTCEFERFENVIDSMLGGGDGVTDSLMDYSDCHTGSYWFMPSQQDLDAALTS